METGAGSMPGELMPAGVIKVGRRRLFRRTDVMTWIAARDAEQNGQVPRDPNKSPPPSGKSGRRHKSPAGGKV